MTTPLERGLPIDVCLEISLGIQNLVICLRWNFAKISILEISSDRASYSFFENESTVQTGITCKMITCYMRDSACRSWITKTAIIFWIYVEHFHFLILPLVRNYKFFIGICKYLLMKHPIVFLDWDNETKIVPYIHTFYFLRKSGPRTSRKSGLYTKFHCIS